MFMFTFPVKSVTDRNQKVVNKLLTFFNLIFFHLKVKEEVEVNWSSGNKPVEYQKLSKILTFLFYFDLKKWYFYALNLFH